MIAKVPSLPAVLGGASQISSSVAEMSLRKRMCLILAVMAASMVILVSRVDRNQLDISIHSSTATVGSLLPTQQIGEQASLDTNKPPSDPPAQPEQQQQEPEQQQPPEERPFWENFVFNEGLYHGLLNLVHMKNDESLAAAYLIDDPRQSTATHHGNHPVPKIYNPYPDYTSSEWRAEWRGNYKSCIGPRGIELDSSVDDMVTAYSGVPEGFPAPAIGAFEAIGLDNNVCFDRYSRLGAYGYGEEDPPAAIPGWMKPSIVDWNETRWGDLQKQCSEKNSDRFDFSPRNSSFHIGADRMIEKVESRQREARATSEEDGRTAHDESSSHRNESTKARPRTAVLVRTWTGYEYTPNVLRQLRSMIVELSLQSGGEYAVFLLVHVKDANIPIYSDPLLYERIKQKHVPREFWDISILWNENMNTPWYPLLKDHSSVHDAQFMPVQRFSIEHPEFDYYWNWEIDTRYIGHHFHFTNQISEWAKQQPRRGIWERSERFFIPSAHGDYETEFREEVQKLSGHQVWGPVKVEDVHSLGPKPPVYFPQNDKYDWGVGEEADLITLLPLFDPQDTDWSIHRDVWNYREGESTYRRATIVCQVRLSRRLLDMMHEENLSGHHMASEMWPHTISLHHGLKAVYAPHPIFMDRAWPTDALTQIYNPGPQGVSGSHPLSVFSWGREEVFRGFTWYYHATFPAHLYRLWMGWRDGNKGGEAWESEQGRMCLPGMLLHPIKDAVFL